MRVGCWWLAYSHESQRFNLCKKSFQSYCAGLSGVAVLQCILESEQTPQEFVIYALHRIWFGACWIVSIPQVHSQCQGQLRSATVLEKWKFHVHIKKVVATAQNFRKTWTLELSQVHYELVAAHSNCSRLENSLCLCLAVWPLPNDQPMLRKLWGSTSSRAWPLISN